VGVLRRLVRKIVLHHEELQLPERLDGVVLVGSVITGFSP